MSAVLERSPQELAVAALALDPGVAPGETADQVREVVTLAVSIADELSAMELESLCPCVAPTGGACEWFDTNLVLEEDELQVVKRAVQYLLLRGRLEKHPTFSGLYRVPAGAGGST